MRNKRTFMQSKKKKSKGLKRNIRVHKFKKYFCSHLLEQAHAFYI